MHRAIERFLSMNRVDPSYLPRLGDKFRYEEPGAAYRLTNFFALLALATVIATYGVTSNSDATVIGAMIVAPLMTPIMGTAFGIVTGSPYRALRSLALVVVGVVVVVGVSLLLAGLVPSYQLSFTQNTQITSRISPNLIALIIALAAGAAGAYCTAREEIADALPGVAIAISLVPPLSVVGISLSRAEWAAAQGSMLLFTTNFLAILMAGGVVFWALGVDEAARATLDATFRRRAFWVVSVSIVLLALLLGSFGYEAARQAQDVQTANNAVERWLGDARYEIVAVNVDHAGVEVTIVGQGPVASVDSLAAELRRALGRDVPVKLRVVPRQEYYSGPAP